MLGEAKPSYVYSILKPHFRVSSPPWSLSQAVVCVSTPRKYPRSGYFLVNYTFVYFSNSSESLATRVLDAKAKVLITADGVWRGKKLIHLLEIAAEAMNSTKSKGHTVETNIVVCHLPRLHETAPDYEKTINSLFDESRDTWWHDAMKTASDECK